MLSRAVSLVAVVTLAFALLLPGTALAQEEASDIYRSGTSQDVLYQQAEPIEEEELPTIGWTILNYSLSGGALGAIVGTGLWILSGRDLSLWLIPQFTAGGVIIGAGVGALVVLGQDREPIVATSADADRPNSVKWIERDIPESFDLPILQLNF